MQPTNKRKQRLMKLQQEGSSNFEARIDVPELKALRERRQPAPGVYSAEQGAGIRGIQAGSTQPSTFGEEHRIYSDEKKTFSLKVEGIVVKDLTSETYQKMLSRISELMVELKVSVVIDGVCLTEDK